MHHFQTQPLLNQTSDPHQLFHPAGMRQVQRVRRQYVDHVLLKKRLM